MSHILKGLSKRNTHIPHIALFDEGKWHKRCSNAYFGVFRGGGLFWRVTLPLESQRQYTLLNNALCYIGDTQIAGREPTKWWASCTSYTERDYGRSA